MSSLSTHRLDYKPELPQQLLDVQLLHLTPFMIEKQIDPAVQACFPMTASQPILHFKTGENVQPETHCLKVGVLFSGGQAPGGHNVISGLLDGLKKINPASELIGFIDGPAGVIKNCFVVLNEESIAPYRNQGGFNLIGSGRDKIETDAQFQAVEKTLRDHQLDALVIIGGDDSNTNAALLAEYCSGKGIRTAIIGVPKTIDGDLKNEFIETSFGFDTASKIYSEFIGNLAIDALSAKKYYFFVKLMGRSASHLTLECALQTHVNLALIGEEVASKNLSLRAVVGEVANLICQRDQQGKNYGVILVPEGLLEFIPECSQMIGELNHLSETIEKEKLSPDKVVQLLTSTSSQCFLMLPLEIQKQLLIDRDPHGNIQLSKIETERLLIDLVRVELDRRRKEGGYHGKFNPQPLFYGYEGRSGLPSNFDCKYCYALGHVAALLVNHRATGYLCCLRKLAQSAKLWEPFGIPIVKLLHFEMKKGKLSPVIKKQLVDLNSPAFKAFEKERSTWQMADDYRCPGPIQFEGTEEITDSITFVLTLDSRD
jgi:pyrophosphate--fructose-6-phosphate 1-phosphotransferase